MSKVSLRTAIPLIAAVGFSLLPWVFSFAIFHNTPNDELEGAYYVAAFVGALSFAITGPLAAVALSSFSRKGRPLAFAGLYAAVSLPTIAFQVWAYGTSIMVLFIPHGSWTLSNTTQEMTYAAIASCAWYIAYFLILYKVSMSAPDWTKPTALISAVCSFALIAVRAMHA